MAAGSTSAGFVPLTGRAVLHVGEPPRASVVEFSDEQRTVSLSVRGAVPLLTRAHAGDAAPASVRLLGGAVLIGLRVVAAGSFAPQGDRWVPVLGADDDERIVMLARARAAVTGDDAALLEGRVRAMVAAVVDALPTQAPSPASTPQGRPEPGVRARGFQERLQAIIAERTGEGSARSRPAEVRRSGRGRPASDVAATPAGDLPHLVDIALRVEISDPDDVDLASVVVVQVHESADPLHVCDAALLWEGSGPGAGHGFGERARVHTTLALRRAADVWPPLERLLDLRVPDRIDLDAGELADLLESGAPALRRLGVEVLWPRAMSGPRVETRPTLKPARGRPLMQGLFSPEALFEFSWEHTLRGEPLSRAEVDRLARATQPLIRLRDHWVVVDPTTARRARKRLIRTVKPAAALAATLTRAVTIGEEEHQVVVGATLERVRADLLRSGEHDLLSPPAGLQATLRDYQLRGLTWLDHLTGLGLGGCLADDMGLGKTITVIALHLHRAEQARLAGRPPPAPTLVACPASLLGNWEAEIRRFAPGVPVRRHHAASRDLTGLDGGFVVTTYATMRRDQAKLRDVRWGLVVADEAQHIKNATSSTAKALRTLGSEARVALTGTPVENDLTELWAILDWTNPGLLGSRNAFRKVWAAPIESGVDPAVTRRFAELIRPFLLRRRKSDPGVAPELPAKTETDHLVGLAREQVVLYEALVRDSLERIARSDPETRRGLVLRMLTGLKQICNHPAHYLKQSGGRLGGRSEKFDLLDELLGTILAEGGRVLVFTQYVEMGRLLSRHLDEAGLRHRFLHGGIPVSERESMVAGFQTGDVPVFLLSLKAGGTGLNLTAADHVVHFDRWWNPAVEEQATDRAYRIGQTRPVQVHRLVCEGTIEERIAALLLRKRTLADSVLADGGPALTELDDDELRDLVRYRPRA